RRGQVVRSEAEGESGRRARQGAQEPAAGGSGDGNSGLGAARESKGEHVGDADRSRPQRLHQGDPAGLRARARDQTLTTTRQARASRPRNHIDRGSHISLCSQRAVTTPTSTEAVATQSGRRNQRTIGSRKPPNTASRNTSAINPSSRASGPRKSVENSRMNASARPKCGSLKARAT